MEAATASAEAASGGAARFAGEGRAGTLSGNPGVRGMETITSKHVEAELNRLEAELAN